MPDAIKVDGLADFVRNLKKLDSNLPKAVRLALNDAANVVVDYVRPQVPKRSGRAARSIRARSTRQAVRVSAGGKRAPYYPWLDFGGKVGPAKSVRRPFLKDGRYLYEGYYVKKSSGELFDVMSRSLLDVVRSAGIEVD